ncbi:MAG: hypothetical protein HKN33_09365 [Pyrinomonadaceae bacterium]|nr:hypothetical protein [Pyrinomonadaceae bacterium]
MRILLLIGLVFAFGVAAIAQTSGEPPTVADNATPADNNIKLRSVELERIKREAEKNAVLRRDNGKELKFSIVKEDFEGIQKEQSKIVEAYVKNKEIDYKQIKESSNKISEMAVRLRANVFAPDAQENDAKDDSPEVNPFFGKSVRDLIIALDGAIGEVVTSPMWQKLKVVDPKVAVPVEASLVKVIDISGALWLASNKKLSTN